MQLQKLHDHFQEWVAQWEIETILEVGCGTGLYGRIFDDKRYFGNDISIRAIEEARRQDKNKNHGYIASDFIQDSTFECEKADLVFSHTVIDHVYDVDGFLEKMIRCSKKHVWITAYLEPLETEPNHRMNWQEAGYYFNNLSIPELKNVLGLFDVKYNFERFQYDPNQIDAFVIKIEHES